MINQQGDVLLFQANDGGDINVNSGVIEMSTGLDTSVYLSLFGGNKNDDGSSKSKKSWWGNLTESNFLIKQYRSKTQYILNSMVFSVPNMQKLDDAILEDLNWLLEENIISVLEVTTQIIGANMVGILIEMVEDNERKSLYFTTNWVELI